MRVVVLGDGETWTTIRSCRVLDVPDTVKEEDLDIAIEDIYHDTSYFDENGTEHAGSIVAYLDEVFPNE